MSAAATPTPASKTLVLVDASMYVFRAWHSMPDEFHDADGWPTNAVHGFARFMLELLERERPGHIAIAFYERIREKLKGDGRRYFIDPAKMYPVAVIVVGVLGLLFLSTVYMDVVSPIKL